MLKIGFVCLTLLFSAKLKGMDQDPQWLIVVAEAQKTKILNPTILTFFDAELTAPIKPLCDMKYIHLQGTIHNLKSKAVPYEARATLLKHLWLSQMRHEEAQLLADLRATQDKMAELITELAPHKEDTDLAVLRKIREISPKLGIKDNK